MTTIQRLTAKMIEAGDVVHQYGYRYQVRENLYDPHGNTGHSPRFVFVADALSYSDGSPLKPEEVGTIYTKGMTLGHCPDDLVTVEVKV